MDELPFRCIVYFLFLNALVLFLLISNDVDSVLRRCLTINDCGLAGACVKSLNSDYPVCDCSITDSMFTVDYEGYCSKLMTNHCSYFPPKDAPQPFTPSYISNYKTLCINEGAKCVPLFSSFMCECNPHCIQIYCEACSYDIVYERMKPYIGFQVKGLPLTIRQILICVDNLLERSKILIVFHRSEHDDGKLGVFLQDYVFKNNDNAYEYCVKLKIDESICSFFPKNELKCAIHEVVYPYTVYMGMALPDPKMIYHRTRFESKEVREHPAILGFKKYQRDFYAISHLGFFSDFYERKFICNPLVVIFNYCPYYQSSVYRHVSQSDTLRVNITLEPRCSYEVIDVSLHWMRFKVQSSFSSTHNLKPISKQIGGMILTADRYHEDVKREIFIKVEAWASVRVYTLYKGGPRKYSNFEFALAILMTWEPEPIIAGGMSRTLYVGTEIELDSSLSYDPNIKPRSPHLLEYRWSCSYDVDGCVITESKENIFRPDVKGEVGKNITFVLHVINRKYSRVSLGFSQHITFVNEKIPEVYILCKRNCGGVMATANPYELIYLEARLRDGHNSEENWTWTCKRISEDLKMKEDVDLKKIRKESRLQSRLIVEPERLFHSKKLKFFYEFSVTGGGNPPGQASYVIEFKYFRSNQVSIHIQPSNAEATHFLISVNGWTDDLYSSSIRDNLYFEFYQEDDNTTEVMFFFNTRGWIRYAPVVNKNIYVVICDSRGRCKSVASEVEKLGRPSVAQVNSMEADIHEFKTKWFRLDDALMNGIAVLQYADDLKKDKIVFVEEFMSFLYEVPVYYLRDVHQMTSIFCRFILKRSEFFGIRSVNVTTLTKAVHYLKKLSSTAVKDSYYLYPQQADFSYETYVNLSTKLLTCVEILLDWRHKIMLETDSIRIHLKCKSLSVYVTSIIEDVVKLCGRKRYNEDPSVIFKYNDLHFWVKVNDMVGHSKSTERPSNLAAISIPDEFAVHYDEEGSSFTIGVVVFSRDPYWWNKELQYRKMANFLLLTMMTSSVEDYVYDTTIHRSQSSKHFNLEFSLTAVMSSYSGKCEVPPKNADEIVKDAALDVYKIKIPRDLVSVRIILNFVVIESGKELLIKFCKDLKPDYDLITQDPDAVLSETRRDIYFDASSSSDVYHYLGILPKGEEGVSVNYTFEACIYACVDWDRDAWRSRHCNVGFANKTTVLCHCYHFSGFSAMAAEMESIKLDQTLYMVTTRLRINYINILLLLLLLLLFLLLLLLFWLWDQRDKIFARVIILEDNVPGDHFPYLLAVFTGNRMDCGTTATVGFRVHGQENLSSRPHVLKCTWRSVLTKGSDDWFIFFTSLHLGEIQYLELWQDYSGENPSWYCRRILLFDLYEYKEYVFLVEAWSTVLLKEDGLLYFDVDVATDEQRLNRDRLARSNSLYGLREGHLVIGMFYKHPRSNFFRYERAAVLYLMILVMLAFSRYMLHDLTVHVFDLTESYLTWNEVIISIECAMIVAPVVFIIGYCFRRSRVVSDDDMDNKIYDHSSSSLLILRRRIESITNQSSCRDNYAPYIMIQPLQPVIVTAHPDFYEWYRKRTHCMVIAWFIVIVGIIFLLCFLLYFCYTFPFNRSIRWWLSLIVALLFYIFIVEPTVIMICGFILAYFCMVSHKISRIEVVDRESLQYYCDDLQSNQEYMKNLNERRLQPCYTPLAIKRERLIRKVMYHHWIRKWTAFDLATVIFYVVIFFVMVQHMRIHDCVTAADSIKNFINAPTNTTVGFENVLNVSMFFEYLSNNLIPRLHTKYFYNNDLLTEFADNDPTRSFYLDDYCNKVVGMPRIRMQRVKGNSCEIISQFNQNASDVMCRDLLNNNEDTSDHTRSGTIKLRNLAVAKTFASDSLSEFEPIDVYRKNSPQWQYQHSYETKAITMAGSSGYVYHGGGYVALLGKTEKDALIVLDGLQEDNWINELTRVIFVEIVLYNINTNVFTTVVLISEHFANGVFLNTVKVHSITTAEIYMDFVCYSVFCVFIVILIIMSLRAYYLIQLYSCERYFKIVPHLIYFVALIFGICTIIAWLFYLYVDLLVNKTFSKAIHRDKYIGYYEPLYRERTRNSFLAVFTALIVIRIVFFLQIGQSFDVFHLTVNRVVLHTLQLLIVAVFFVLGFQFFGILIGNPFLPDNNIFLTSHLSFPHLVHHMDFPGNKFIPFLICLAPFITIFFFRIVILYYYARSKFTTTKNMFVLDKKWRLQNAFPYNLRQYLSILSEKRVKFSSAQSVLKN